METKFKKIISWSIFFFLNLINAGLVIVYGYQASMDGDGRRKGREEEGAFKMITVFEGHW